MVKLKKSALWLAGLVLVSSAQATPVTITVENQSPGQSVAANVAAGRASFLTNLSSSVASYSFENEDLNTDAPLSANFAGSGGSTIVATLQGGGSVSSADNGRFNTTAGGSKFWQTQAGSASSTVGTFSISFSTAISAFGFYGTDIGDFEGTLTLLLTGANGTANQTIVVSNTPGASNGSLLFFGFYDLTGSYSSISFLSSSPSGTDFFGFDDFIVADAGQILAPTPTLPEPTSLALTGLALAAAGFAALRARRA